MKQSIKLFAMTLLVGLLSAASADAGTVVATFNDIDRNTFKYTVLGNNHQTFAGRFQWTRTGGDHPDLPAGNFDAFCIELDQNVAFGQSFEYDVIATADGPKPGLLLGAGSMGPGRAEMLGKLWAAYYDDTTTSSTAAGAFQVAVWETLYDDDTDLFAGDFKANYADLASSPAFVKLAQDYLDSLPNLTTIAPVAALSSPTAQDQLFVVPTPAAAFAGLGLLGAIFIARHKKRKAAL